MSDTELRRPMPGSPNRRGGWVGVGLGILGLVLLLIAAEVGGPADWLVVVAPMLMAAGLVLSAYCFADASPRRTFCEGCGRPERRRARYCPTCGRRSRPDP